MEKQLQEYRPGDHGYVKVLSRNSETGIVAESRLEAAPTPSEMKAWLIKEYGQQIGIVYADLKDLGLTPIGTVHSMQAPYPDAERTFQRVSYALVTTAAGRMSREQREAYLEAVVPVHQPRATKAKADPDPTEAPAPKAGSAKKRATAKSSVKPTKRR